MGIGIWSVIPKFLLRTVPMFLHVASSANTRSLIPWRTENEYQSCLGSKEVPYLADHFPSYYRSLDLESKYRRHLNYAPGLTLYVEKVKVGGK